MKYFQRKRLEKLAEYLRTVPRKKFYILTWGDYLSNLYSYEESTDFDACTLKNECNTVGCAMGWACTIPSFKRAGLKLENNSIQFKNWTDFDAAVCFFGMTIEEAQDMFSSAGYDVDTIKQITPIMVSNKIKKFLKEKDKASK